MEGQLKLKSKTTAQLERQIRQLKREKQILEKQNAQLTIEIARFKHDERARKLNSTSNRVSGFNGYDDF